MTWAQSASLACRLLAGTVFAVSFVSKVRGRKAWAVFGTWFASIPLRPLGAKVAPIALAAAEAVVVVLVAIPATGTVGLVAATALCLALTAGLALAVSRGAHEPCHCFGISSEPLGRQQIIRNALLLAATSGGAVSAIAGGAGPSAPAPTAAVIVAVTAGVTVAILIMFSDDAVGLIRPADASSRGRFP